MRSPRNACAVVMSAAANASPASATCKDADHHVAVAATKSASAEPVAGTSCLCATTEAMKTATSGGSANATNPRWARPSSPLAAARPVATAPANAVSRSQGPGLPTRFLQAPPQVAQRPRAGDVGDAVEVVRRRRGGGVPLEGVPEPRVAAGAGAASACSDDVDE